MRCGLMGVEASVSAVMNSKHLHYSRKPVRLRDGEEEGRKESKCPAPKLAARDLTCYKAWSNKNTASLRAPAPPHYQYHTHRYILNPHTFAHTLAQPALFEMFVLLMCSTSGRIRLNARRPQALRSVVLIRTNRSPSLARAGPGVRGEKRGERGREREDE